MVVLLAACRVSVLGDCLSWEEGGITLTWAPVSMRKRIEEEVSVTKSRRLGVRPVTSAAATYWPCRFPGMNRVACTYELLRQSGRGTNTFQ